MIVLANLSDKLILALGFHSDSFRQVLELFSVVKYHQQNFENLVAYFIPSILLRPRALST